MNHILFPMVPYFASYETEVCFYEQNTYVSDLQLLHHQTKLTQIPVDGILTVWFSV
jgi:hypothetical protein